LEKFKYVLDFKIQELKRDIAPREQEIMTLKFETNKMDESLKKYNKINANLGFVVDELKNKQQEMHKLNQQNRILIRKNESYVQAFKTAVYWVVQYIDDFDQLKRAVHNSLYKYVKDQAPKIGEEDPDILHEFDNQRKFLKNSVDTLRRRLEKEGQIHKEDTLNIMNDNIKLIDMINRLRTEVSTLDTRLKGEKARNAEQTRNLIKMGIHVPTVS